MNSEENMTMIWRKYENCRDYLDRKALITRTDSCWDFYAGDQWKGIQAGGEQLPMLNFIKPVCKYKIATVAQNSLVAVFSDLEHREEYQKYCDLLERDFTKTWEKAKMDTLKWDLVKAACVQGDSYLFFGTERPEDVQLIANTAMMMGDENEPDIQKQPYIIIYERVLVERVKEIAKQNGVDEVDIAMIAPDTDTQYQVGNKEEVRGSDKCSSILYLEKKDGIVNVARSTRGCVYEPLRPIAVTRGGEQVGGLTLYPIVSMIWEKLPNSARGNSEVRQLMPNQLELNKTLARRSMSVKMTAFPKIAYDATAIQNEEDLTTVGAAIAMQGASSNIDQMIKYLNPASMSHDAESLQSDLMQNTMTLAGAQDTALGNVDPERVSGTAITAIRDQAALPLNEQVSAYRQVAEDLALLRYDMMVAYAPEEGIAVSYTDDYGNEVTEMIPAEVLETFRPNVKVDVSSDNAWSKYAEQQELANLLATDKITLQEYLEALPNNSSLPKNKLLKLIERRANGNSQNVQMQDLSGGVSGLEQIQGAYSDAQAGADYGGGTAGEIAGY